MKMMVKQIEFRNQAMWTSEMSMTHQWHSPHWIRLPAGCQHYQHHAALAGARASIVRDLPVQQGVQAFPLYDRSVSQAVQGYLSGAAQPLADNPAKWPTQPRQTENKNKLHQKRSGWRRGLNLPACPERCHSSAPSMKCTPPDLPLLLGGLGSG